MTEPLTFHFTYIYLANCNILKFHDFWILKDCTRKANSIKYLHVKISVLSIKKTFFTNIVAYFSIERNKYRFEILRVESVPRFGDFQIVILGTILVFPGAMSEKVPEVPASALTREAALLSVLHNVKSCLKIYENLV